MTTKEDLKELLPIVLKWLVIHGREIGLEVNLTEEFYETNIDSFRRSLSVKGTSIRPDGLKEGPAPFNIKHSLNESFQKILTDNPEISIELFNRVDLRREEVKELFDMEVVERTRRTVERIDRIYDKL